MSDVRRLIVYDLASKNPYAAARYLDQIDRALTATAEYPYSKQDHPHLGVGVRKILISPYIIFYRVRGDRFEALRFLHSHQNITRQLIGQSQ